MKLLRIQTLTLLVSLAAASIANAATYMYCDRYSNVDATHYKFEQGTLRADGFIPTTSSNFTYGSDVSALEVAPISGQPVMELSLWLQFKDLGPVAVGNFERSATTYQVEGVPMVIARYTLGANGGTFDSSPTPTVASGGLINISCRAVVPAGGQVIPGFVLSTRTQVLIRAGGPALAAYGVPNTLANPSLRVFSGANEIARNDDWSTQIASTKNVASSADVSTAITKTGAGPYPTNSKDAAVLLTLDAGAYSAFVESPAGTTAGGEVLFEVYQVP